MLYLTTDGGATWQRQSGGAAAIEIGDGNVLRVQGCFPGCPLTVQISTIGGTAWRTVLALSSAQVGLQTRASSSRAPAGTRTCRCTGHVTGGASEAHSALYVSADGGLNWADRGEPCPQVSPGEVDACRLELGVRSNPSACCAPSGRARRPSWPSRPTVAVPFQSGKLLHNLEIQVGSASSSTVFAVGTVSGRESLVRSVDRGRTWTVVAQSGSLTGSSARARRLPRLRVGDNRPVGQPERSQHHVDDSRRWRDLGPLHIPLVIATTGVGRLG